MPSRDCFSVALQKNAVELGKRGQLSCCARSECVV